MTLDLLLPAYPWVKSLHVVSVIAWMAGIFYLPRLYVYHCDVPRGSAEGERFKVMERRLLMQIMRPAMLSAWLFGTLLVLTPGVVDWSHPNWWWVKLPAVLLMTGFQGALGAWRRGFLEDRNQRPARFYRMANEVPTVLMLVVVVMVVAKPF